MHPTPISTPAITTGQNHPSTREAKLSWLASACQTLAQMSAEGRTMAFKNEMVSDADIDRYNLPFPKGGGRWWTRDAERDYYLWGGLTGNLAYDDRQEGRFDLYADKTTYSIALIPGKGSQSLKELPYLIRWKKVLQITPEIQDTCKRELIIKHLKEALTIYGYDGENNTWPKTTKIIFEF